MTTTLVRTDSTTRTPSGAELLRELMHDALTVAADDAAESFDSRTATGRTLLSLAAVAREAAGALGTEPGMPLTSAPGVVVVRELAAAVRLLDRAGTPDAEAGAVDGLLPAAKALHAQLHEALARAGR
ncbi:hypothetical protein [Geodermatophilus sp. URMC 64]